MSHFSLVHNINQCKSLSKHAFSIKSKFNKNNGALLCTYKRASMTLEAAIVLPLVILFMAGVLFFFRLLQIQTGIQEALNYAGRKTAVMCALESSDIVLSTAANTYFKGELQLSDSQNRWICGEKEGLMAKLSDNSNEYIVITIEYKVKSPFNVLGFSDIQVKQVTKCRKWIGNQETIPTNEEKYVYITQDGEAYHKTPECNYLDLSISAQSLENIRNMRNHNGIKYRPCNQCVAENDSNLMYFITDYGEFYHASLSCGALKRTVYCVLITEVGERHPCSKCLTN